MIRATPDGVLLAVRVIPRSRTTGLGGTRRGALVVRLHAPPVDGAANAALVEFLASLLRVPRSSVQVRSGERGRLKQIAIAGVSVDAVRAAVSAGAA